MSHLAMSLGLRFCMSRLGGTGEVGSLVPRLPPVRTVKKNTEGESLVRFRT